MSSITPKIVFINLAESTERRVQIEAHLAGLGLKGCAFSAIDGRKLSTDEVAAVYDAKRAESTEWGALTRGEIGCALSHRAIWRELIDSGDRGWLVIEDDILLAPDVPDWLGKLADLANDGDVIPFVKTSSTPYFFHRAKLDSRWLVYPNQSFIGATAYYITPLAAQRLLQASTPIWFPIDCWYSSPGFKGVTSVRAVWPEAVSLCDDTVEASTIGHRQAHTPKIHKQKNWLRKNISNARRYLKNRFFNTPVRSD
jgi:glycosyl transferase family 25